MSVTHPEERTEVEDVAAERTVAEVTEAEKVQFLQLIRQGLNRQEAANALDYKARIFRALCAPESKFYDEDFAAAYGDAIGSLEHRAGHLERLRAEAQRRALTDSDRLLEKLLMVYDPDWQVLRQKDVNVNVHVLVERVFSKLPLERKEMLLSWLDEIEEGEVVDAQVVGEITAGGTEEAA